MKEINDNSLVNEIKEVEEEEKFYYSSSDLFEIDHHGEVEGSLFSFDFHNHDEHDVVYAAVWNKNVSQEESRMDALLWTLNHVVKVDTILIESDMEAKAILNLIPICNIRKADSWKMKSSRRGNGTAAPSPLKAKSKI
ncbi:hypothetical protein RND71_011016 [Anisodus tanguticus]|uniref:Uncharacterized protein n=1 Tax=Anisodus tanguticus TaxID=243964 RepID=A0AAE1SMS0_9SOLA|nr:hypothetical protein RND71_011016 [Anisodus tanguticus]